MTNSIKSDGHNLEVNSSTLKTSKDVVTLSTFGMQEKWNFDKAGVKKFIDGQIDNIKIMKASFNAAASEVGLQPPIFVLSALMIPQWKCGEYYTDHNYSSAEYKTVKDEYISYLREKCVSEGIIVQDFYDEVATKEEQDYLHELEALGSTADLIKNRAIIANQGNRHLQIDTNTILVDRKAFYKATIGAEKQQDGINASYYDESGLYISPHNKVVYTPNDSKFPQCLAKQHDDYVAESKNRQDRKTPSSNQIYSVCFSKATMDSGFVSYQRKYFPQWNNLWGCYSVDFDQPVYDMTKHIVTAINMSWSQGDGKVDYCAALKSVKVPVQSKSNEITTLDFQAFSYLIKKYTNPKLPEDVRTSLINISDRDYDKQAINSFVQYVINTKDISLLGPILRTIPDTKRGYLMLNDLWDTFKNNSNFQEIIKNPVISDKVTPEDLDVLAKFIPDNSELTIEKANLAQKSKELLGVRNEQLKESLDSIKENIYQDVKIKLDKLGAPYLVTESDKQTLFATINSLMIVDCMKDLTLDGFKQVALSAATNKLLNDKLKQQPTVVEALRHQDNRVHDKVLSKIYIPPINEKFNRAEIDKMVSKIVLDVGLIRAEPTRNVFFEDPQVKQYIHSLNELAALRPMNADREALIEKIAGVLVNAVNSFSNLNSDPKSMSHYLKDRYEEVQKSHPTLLSFEELVTPIHENESTHNITLAIKERLNKISRNSEPELHTDEKASYDSATTF